MTQLVLYQPRKYPNVPGAGSRQAASQRFALLHSLLEFRVLWGEEESALNPNAARMTIFLSCYSLWDCLTASHPFCLLGMYLAWTLFFKFHSSITVNTQYYYFQVYSVVLTHLYNLQTDPPGSLVPTWNHT